MFKTSQEFYEHLPGNRGTEIKDTQYILEMLSAKCNKTQLKKIIQCKEGVFLKRRDFERFEKILEKKSGVSKSAKGGPVSELEEVVRMLKDQYSKYIMYV